jgi:hypothetical protein
MDCSGKSYWNFKLMLDATWRLFCSCDFLDPRRLRRSVSLSLIMALFLLDVFRSTKLGPKSALLSAAFCTVSGTTRDPRPHFWQSRFSRPVTHSTDDSKPKFFVISFYVAIISSSLYSYIYI